MRMEIRMSGVGGQGIVTMGLVIGRAAALYDKMDVVMTEAYGPEIMGGFSKANVIISDGEIDYPLIDYPDVLLVMSQDGWVRDGSFVRKDGLVLFEHGLVDPGDPPDRTCIPVPAIHTADELNKRVIANVIMMGAFQKITGLITDTALETALMDRIPKGTEELNMIALQKGYEIGKAAGRWSP
jgi:2-oxoglutarate ferredoxin oxidoreductase subunit gamma